MKELTKFGFLAERPVSLEFGDYSIKPLDCFEEVLSGVKKAHLLAHKTFRRCFLYEEKNANTCFE